MKSLDLNQMYEPERCWVGEQQKICYATQDEAEGAARLVEQEHGLPVNTLSVYKCEYDDHWHLSGK